MYAKLCTLHTKGLQSADPEGLYGELLAILTRDFPRANIDAPIDARMN
jgi:hypothetical protein